MRRLLALLVAVFAVLSLYPVRAEEPQDMGGLYGTLAFDENLNETLNLTMEFQWIWLDGRNVSAQGIRDAYGTDKWDSMLPEIRRAGEEVFNRTLWNIESHGTAVDVSIGNIEGDGALYLYMNGSGSLNRSSEDPELFRAMLGCGLKLTMHLEPADISLKISVSDGWKINGRCSYLWEGEEVDVTLEGPEPEDNMVDVLMDIYHIDTSGEQQNLMMNLSVNATVYSVPISMMGNFSLPEGLNVSMPTIELINLMVERSILDRDYVHRKIETYMDEMNERIVRRFPGAENIQKDAEIGASILWINISAEVVSPVSDFSPGAFLRWYASQRMVLELSGMDSSTVNYTVVIPNGMKILSIEHRDAPVIYMDFGEREGFLVSIADAETHDISVDLGFVIDLDPLLPLFAVVLVVFILWLVVARYVPKRRGGHG